MLADCSSPQAAIVMQVRAAQGFFQRLRGLIGQPPPGRGEGFWLPHCRQVHTVFMGYAVDVVHLDSNDQVLAVQTLKPWRLGRFVFRARSVLELRAGDAETLGVRVGSIVRLIASGEDATNLVIDH